MSVSHPPDFSTHAGKTTFVEAVVAAIERESPAAAAEIGDSAPELDGRVVRIVVTDAPTRLVLYHLDGTLVRMPALTDIAEMGPNTVSQFDLRFGPGLLVRRARGGADPSAIVFASFATFASLVVGRIRRTGPDGESTYEPFTVAGAFARGLLDGPGVDALAGELQRFSNVLSKIRTRMEAPRAGAADAPGEVASVVSGAPAGDSAPVQRRRLAAPPGAAP
ncbi:MAG: hypothetical protein L3J97_06540 [Thermoplasmata archaeon]|nr:hypothetical protein [Thermoplasmata archaeon]